MLQMLSVSFVSLRRFILFTEPSKTDLMVTLMKQIFFRFSCILCSIINLRSLEQMPCTELDVLVLRQSGLLEAPRRNTVQVPW